MPKRMAIPMSVTRGLPVHDQEVLAFWPKALGGDQRWVKARFYDASDVGTGNDHFDTAEFEEYPDVLLPGHHITHWLPMPQDPTL